MKKLAFFFLIFDFLPLAYADGMPENQQILENASISANPAAINLEAGNGDFQSFLFKKLNIEDNHGINFDGAWVGDTNALLTGGIPNAEQWTNNSLFVLNLTVDTHKFVGLPAGGLFGVQILQFNGQDTNGQAGSVQGYNSLPGPAPLNRFELYQLWYRQILIEDKLFLRVGKTVPTDDFDNVIKPVPLSQEKLSIPSVSGLIFTPLFINPTTIGVMPGYYNSAYGATVNFTPTKNWYTSYGVYDGNLAQGKQTGLTGPTFNGSYFNIAETGFDWLMGKKALPGNVGVGAWRQTGLVTSGTLSENDTTGYYLFGSQRLWYKDPGLNNSGISAFYQFGANNSDVLPMTKYVGGGFTVFGPIPSRSNDSLGFGTALSWLNQKVFTQQKELMLQTYYQLQVNKDIYIEPAISYIPHPASGVNVDPTIAGTLRVIALF